MICDIIFNIAITVRLRLSIYIKTRSNCLQNNGGLANLSCNLASDIAQIKQEVTIHKANDRLANINYNLDSDLTTTKQEVTIHKSNDLLANIN